MNIVILVSGALGSVVNLVKGNNVPMIISMIAVIVVIVFVIAEWKSRRDKAAVASASVAETIAHREPVRKELVPAGEPIPHPIRVSSEPARGGDRCYTDEQGQRVIRLVVARGRGA